VIIPRLVKILSSLCVKKICKSYSCRKLWHVYWKSY